MTVVAVDVVVVELVSLVELVVVDVVKLVELVLLELEAEMINFNKIR